MSGHNKWASIKHKKGATDAKRGQLFTKLIKEISVAARLGGGDPDANPRLRAAVLKARISNMPRDNVDRAIKKGTGELEGVQFTELTYEGYGPGGVALLINILTDNKNRAAAEIRNILGKHGGSLGAAGSVAYLFKRKGVIALDATKYAEDDVIAVALDAGAADVTNDGKSIEVTTTPETFEAVLDAISAAKLERTFAEVSMVPDTSVTLEPDATRKALRLIELIEEHDDVQSVASNINVPDDFEMPE
jgi:YebC/PmpR family DNA-binding regulatory protein